MNTTRKYGPLAESPAEAIRKTLPRGDAKWPGFPEVYRKISEACEIMGRTPYIHLSEEHLRSCAILGCGHEEAMKHELHRLRMRNFAR